MDILKSPVCKSRLDEHLGKVNSRLATIKLGQEKTKLEFPELKEHIVHLNSVLEEMKSIASLMDVELKEHIVNLEALLKEVKLEPKEIELEPSPKKILFKQEEGKLGSSTEGRKLTPRERKATSPLIAQ